VHTQLFQKQFTSIQTSVLAYQKQMPGLILTDMKVVSNAINDFGYGVTGEINNIVTELTRWGRFVTWFVGSHHEVWTYTPLNKLDVGIPVPRLVNDIASGMHALCIVLGLALLIAIFTRTNTSIIDFSVFNPFPALNQRPPIVGAPEDGGISTSVQITQTEARKRHVDI